MTPEVVNPRSERALAVNNPPHCESPLPFQGVLDRVVMLATPGAPIPRASRCFARGYCRRAFSPWVDGIDEDAGRAKLLLTGDKNYPLEPSKIAERSLRRARNKTCRPFLHLHYYC